jgi:hypothetical protein
MKYEDAMRERVYNHLLIYAEQEIRGRIENNILHLNYNGLANSPFIESIVKQVLYENNKQITERLMKDKEFIKISITKELNKNVDVLIREQYTEIIGKIVDEIVNKKNK